MTTIHILQNGKPVMEITFHRTPTDGSPPNNKVDLKIGLDTAGMDQLTKLQSAINALASALVRQVDECGPKGDHVAIELAGWRGN